MNRNDSFSSIIYNRQGDRNNISYSRLSDASLDVESRSGRKQPKSPIINRVLSVERTRTLGYRASVAR